MHKAFRFWGICSIIIALFIAPTIVLAAPALHQAVQTAPAAPSVDDLVVTLRNMGGLALLVATIGNFGKKYFTSLFPDGSAPTWSLILNLICLAGVAYLKLSGNADLIPVIDTNAGALSGSLSVLLIFAYQLYASRILHQQVLAGLPVVGTSNSNAVAGKSLTQ